MIFLFFEVEDGWLLQIHNFLFHIQCSECIGLFDRIFEDGQAGYIFWWESLINFLSFAAHHGFGL